MKLHFNFQILLVLKFVRGQTYDQTDPAAQTCDTGYEKITSIGDCQAAATILGLEAPVNFPSALNPSGCFVTGGMTLFNPDFSSPGTMNGGISLICTASGKCNGIHHHPP